MKKKEDVYKTIRKDKRFTILTEILEITGIGEAMSTEQEAFTFFAPIDSAFQNMGEKTLLLVRSPEGIGMLSAILGRHLVPKKYLYSNDLRIRKSVKTLHGADLKITNEANILQLDGAHILLPGIASSNAMVFPVDKVLPIKRIATMA